MKITIKDQEVELKNNLRSILIYEHMTDKLFSPRTITDYTIYMYACIMSGNPTIEFALDELIAMLDDDYSLLRTFTEWITNANNKQSYMSSDNGSKKKSKSK